MITPPVSEVLPDARTHAVEYDRWFEEPWGRYAFGVEYRTLFYAADPLDGTRVLDAGCGTGRFALAASAQGAWVVGIDPNPAMLELAAPRLARHCVRGVVEHLPFADAVFDISLAVTVLEFVTDPSAAVAELARVTRPGGRVLIGALNPYSPWGLANRRRLRSGVWCTARFLSRAELRSIGAPHGAIHPACTPPDNFPASGSSVPRSRPSACSSPRGPPSRSSSSTHRTPVDDTLPAFDSVLVVCAHPDDESFGLGALLSTLADAGSRIPVLCYTHGEASTLHAVSGDLARIGAVEMDAAGDVLGVARIELLGYPDGNLGAVPVDDLAAHVVRVADDTAPSALLVFDHGGITGHADHQRATDAALHAATTLDPQVLAWAIPTTVAESLNAEFGTCFVGRADDEMDIEVTVDRARQLDAIRRHRSQSTDNPVLWRRLGLLGATEHLRYLS